MPGKREFPTVEQIKHLQLQQLRELLTTVVPGNTFYTPKIEEAGALTADFV